MTDSMNLSEKANAAVRRYLDRRDYQILDELTIGESFNYVAEDDEDGTIVFIEVSVSKIGDEEEEREETPRAEFEKAAAFWMTRNVESEILVRFDSITLLVTDDNHALLRHHKGRWDSVAA